MIRFSLEIFIWFAAVLSNCLSNFGCVYDDGKIRLEYRSFLAQKFFKLPFIDLPISFDRTETVWVGSTLTFEHVIFETCECHEPNYSKSSVKQIDRSPQTKINFSSLDEVNKGDFFGKLELYTSN